MSCVSQLDRRARDLDGRRGSGWQHELDLMVRWEWGREAAIDRQESR